jgi:cysteinyl-tRNA synthetase
MTLRIHDTLSRQKKPFEPLQPGRVTMYVCGPTVYKPSHIGHMVGPVIFDTVKRYLTYLGYQVEFVVNITDVDDKLIKRAAELNTTVKELAEKMTTDYVECLKKLEVVGITQMPRATETIQEMIDMIAGLVGTGYAYPAAGDVYFNVGQDEDYGKLCHRDPEQLEAGARIEVSDRKRNPGDFALWKGAKPGEPAWDSPWGRGRPGWHIECSAMSMKLLGKTIDIHGGGLDLQFPHHENELAQSESFTGKPFVNYWMHNGLLKMGNSKMAGSVGNVVNMVDLFGRFPPEVIRFLLLGTHYRSPIEYSEDRLAETAKSLQSFHRFFERFARITKKSFFDLSAPTTKAASGDAGEFGALKTRFLEHMDDDFNTGGAVGVLYELLTALNRYIEQRKLEDGTPSAADLATLERGTVLLKECGRLLGLFEKAPATEKSDDKLVAGLAALMAELEPGFAGTTAAQYMERFIAIRAEARKAKNFAVADKVRKRLAELKVTLEDRASGTLWRAE